MSDQTTQTRSFIVTSCKGGIGKSTVSANLAVSVAEMGHRVLVIDCDFSNRSLDLLFGCEELVKKDITDLALGNAKPGEAVIELPEIKDVLLIPAPMIFGGMFTTEQLRQAVNSAAAEFGCDTVIIDTPGAADWLLPVVAPVAQTALIVVSHSPASVRGAEKTGYALEGLGVTDQYLIINRFDLEKVEKHQRPGLNELIDRTHIHIGGVIPESPALELEQEKGRLACTLGKTPEGVSGAFDEAAKRLFGERIPIMSFLPEKQRRLLLNS